MDKIAAYGFILRNHPFWTKEAGSAYGAHNIDYDKVSALAKKHGLNPETAEEAVHFSIVSGPKARNKQDFVDRLMDGLKGGWLGSPQRQTTAADKRFAEELYRTTIL